MDDFTNSEPPNREQAQRLLDTSLTEDEWEDVRAAAGIIGRSIKWQAFRDMVVSEVENLLEDLLAGRGLENYRKGIPQNTLKPEHQDLLFSYDPQAELRRKALMFLLTRKLFGHVKTKVKENIRSIPALNYEEEDVLLDLASSVSETDLDTIVGDDMPENLPLIDDTDSETIEVIAHLEEDDGCPHAHQDVQRVAARPPETTIDLLITRCKRCKKVLEQRSATIGTRKLGRKRGWVKPIQEKCPPHAKVVWKKGEEGKTAICCECDAIVDNPENFDWVSKGLEPYGDDPETDEVIIL